jgi:hypothetical protein
MECSSKSGCSSLTVLLPKNMLSFSSYPSGSKARVYGTDSNHSKFRSDRMLPIILRRFGIGSKLVSLG